MKVDAGTDCSPPDAQAKTKTQTFVCKVTEPGDQQFGFTVTLNKTRPTMSFNLAPTSPLVLDKGSVTDYELKLGDQASATRAQRSFHWRTQA